MSKITRNELKDLVKECLVEILSEGISPSSQRSLREVDESRLVEGGPGARSQLLPRKAALPSRSQSPALNSTVFSSNQSRRQSSTTASMRRPAILESVSQITDDPVMSQILADTASTTLQEQIGAESSRPGAPSLQESVGSPMEMFDGAQHWATLAFSDNGNRGQKSKS